MIWNNSIFRSFAILCIAIVLFLAYQFFHFLYDQWKWHRKHTSRQKKAIIKPELSRDDRDLIQQAVILYRKSEERVLKHFNVDNPYYELVSKNAAEKIERMNDIIKKIHHV